jgi:hypothetical protein
MMETHPRVLVSDLLPKHAGGIGVLRIAVVLVLIWAVGLYTKHTMGGFIHVLLVLAVVLGLIGLVRGSNPT